MLKEVIISVLLQIYHTDRNYYRYGILWGSMRAHHLGLCGPEVGELMEVLISVLRLFNEPIISFV